MSGAAILKLTRVAQSDRLAKLCDELGTAVDHGDLGRVTVLDHAIRSTVMAMLGEGAPRDAEDVATLQTALTALNAAVGALRVAQRRGRRTGGVRAVYLAPRAAGV